MSKQVIQHKKAYFALEPDGFSIHTFELSRKLTKHEWETMKSRLYDEQEKHHSGGRAWIYKEAQSCHHVTLYEHSGVRVTMKHSHSDEHDSYHVYMVINPRKLIDPESSYLGILPPEESSIKALRKAFSALFEGSVFESILDQYKLRRVDLCVNLRCDSKKIFRETVRVLRKLPTPNKYKRVFSTLKNKKAAHQIDKHYLEFSCGTHSLVIYDKTFQMDAQGLKVGFEKLPKGVLRFEVQYEREVLRRLEKKLDSDDPSELLRTLMGESQKRICKHFARCFADVQFAQYEEIISRIENSCFEDARKKTMKELATRLQRKQSVDAVLTKMAKEGYDVDSVLERFKKLGISPIPLWKSFCAQSIPGPVKLLELISDEDVEVAYIKKKSK